LGREAGSGVGVDIGAAVGIRTGASWGAGGVGDRGVDADADVGLETRSGERRGGGGCGADEAGGDGRDWGAVGVTEPVGDLTEGLLRGLCSISLTLPLVDIPRPRLDCFCRTRCKFVFAEPCCC